MKGERKKNLKEVLMGEIDLVPMLEQSWVGYVSNWITTVVTVIKREGREKCEAGQLLGSI